MEVICAWCGAPKPSVPGMGASPHKTGTAEQSAGSERKPDLDSRSAPVPVSVLWRHAAAGLPDDDLLVLIALKDRDVWPGFYDGDEGWRFADAEIVPENNPVIWWADLPDPPKG